MATKRYYPGHSARLLHSGQEYFDSLVDIIRSARHTLYLQYYIYDNDQTGALITSELIAATTRGVRVYLMVDGFGSYGLDAAFQQKLRIAGVYFRFFNPLPFPGITQASRRLHHKVCVADGKRASVGGINVADKYRGTEMHPPWYDFAIEVEGYVCATIERSCQEIWSRRYIRERKFVTPHLGREDGLQLRMSQNDWVRGKNQISANYKYMLKGAHKSIDIVASYFIPTRRLFKILLRSAQHGRRVRVVLSRDSDVPFIKPATEYLCDKLLRAGVQIYEYEAAILHAKVCVIDKKWMTIGSHNLNHLSEFMSVEMNIEIFDKTFSTAFYDELEIMMRNDCREVKLEDFVLQSTFFARLKRWASFRLLSFVQRVLYMLNRKEAGKKS